MASGVVCSSLDCSPEKLQRTVVSVVDEHVDQLRERTPNGVCEMRKALIRRKEEDGEL